MVHPYPAGLLALLAVAPNRLGAGRLVEHLPNRDRGRLLELLPRARRCRLVLPPPNEPRPVSDSVPGHLVERHFHDELRPELLVRQVLVPVPPAEPVLSGRRLR